MSTLRDRYVRICDRFVEDIGSDIVDYEIPMDATLKQCVFYCRKHIVNERNHYRFERYTQMVDHYFNEHLDWSGGERRPLIVHVDLGTGPGIFSWVVYDYVQQIWSPKGQPRLVQFGYDRCSAMVELAERFWTEFGLSDGAQFFDSRKALKRAVDTVDGDAYLLITFGHVLIQSHNLDDSSVIDRFARLCNRLARERNAADVLAVDAFTHGRKQHFNAAVERLHEGLHDPTAAGAWQEISIPDSVLFPGSRALMSLRR